jgi:hypothetical protein
MKRLAILVIILSCAAPVSASAHEDDPRCQRAKEQTAAAIQDVAKAQKKYSKAKNKLRNADGRKAKNKARKAKNRAKNALDNAKGNVVGRERLEERYCREDGHDRPSKRR